MCGTRIPVTSVELYQELTPTETLDRLTAEGTDGQTGLFRRFGRRARNTLVLNLPNSVQQRDISRIIIRQGQGSASLTVELVPTS